MAEPDTISPKPGRTVVELPDGSQALVLAVHPADEAAGMPVRVWLATDPANFRREWPDILATCTVIAP